MSTITIKLEQELLRVDSLRGKVDILNRLSIEYMSIDRERAREYNREAFRFAENSQYTEGIHFAQYAYGLYLFKQGNSRGAIQQLKDTLNTITDSESSIAARLYNGLGLVYYTLGSYDEAMEQYMNALAISEKLKLLPTMAGCLHNIGMIYRRQSEFEKALEYANRAFEVLGDDASNSRKAKSLNEIGLIKMELELYADALSLFMQSLEFARMDESLLFEAMALTNIGLANQNLRDFSESEKYNLKAISIYKELGDKRGLAVAYINLATLLGNQQQHNNGVKQLEHALDLALSIDSKPLVFRIHKLLSEAYQSLESHELALEHYQQFHDIKEQVFNESSEERLRRVTADYEMDKVLRESEIHRLKNIELARSQQSARLGSWEWDVSSDTVRGSDEFYRMVGKESEDTVITGNDLLNCVQHEDALAFRSAVENILQDGEPIEMTVRVHEQDKGERIVHVKAELGSEKLGTNCTKVFGTIQDITVQSRAKEERENLIAELQEALSQVKALSGLVPICANCKKIRDDKGFWNQLEEYIMQHSDAVFSHGICPDCTHDLYPELYKKDE